MWLYYFLNVALLLPEFLIIYFLKMQYCFVIEIMLYYAAMLLHVVEMAAISSVIFCVDGFL